MKYMLLMNYGADEVDGMMLPPDEVDRAVGFMNGLLERLQASGELVAGEGLAPPRQARTVRYVDNSVVVTDGPFGESKEVLAGFWIVQCSAARAEEIAAEIVTFTRDAIQVRRVDDAPPRAAEGTSR